MLLSYDTIIRDYLLRNEDYCGFMCVYVYMYVCEWQRDEGKQDVEGEEEDLGSKLTDSDIWIEDI